MSKFISITKLKRLYIYCKVLRHLVFLYGTMCLGQMLKLNAYTLFARATLTVWTSEI